MNESSSSFAYECVLDDEEEALTCAASCIGIFDCNNCQCRVALLEDTGGTWGDVLDVLLILLPIVFLIVVTIKPKNPWKTTASLPTAAVLLAWIRLAYFESDVVLLGACIIQGLHEALTPLSIMAGAILLFETMEATLCLPYMMREMKALTAGHPVAEIQLLFAFCYMVEGASGFGTPVALGAPMLVSTGHDALESVVALLLFNTFATVWGAVGTPIWFGLGTVETSEGNLLSDNDLRQVSQKAAVALVIAAVVLIPWIEASTLVPRQVVRRNILFVYASILVTVVPSLGLALVNYEFPSLVGGLVGCGLTSVLIVYKVGLHEVEDDTMGRSVRHLTSTSEHGVLSSSRSLHKGLSNVSQNSSPRRHTTFGETENLEVELGHSGDAIDSRTPTDDISSDHDITGNSDPSMPIQDTIEERLGPRKSMKEGYLRESLFRTFPIWGVVLILVLTRVHQIGIKEYLIKQEPYVSIHFGNYGTFRLSSSLVFQLREIFSYPGLSWKYDLLYVPFLIPFVLVSALTMLLFRSNMTCSPLDIVRTVVNRLRSPAVALAGALVLVQLVINKGNASPAYLLGTILADWFQQGFVVVSPLLGALGSFFSGSTTVSNLTFGSIQQIAAESIGTSSTTMLALQSVGASAGNGICLNNIIAACAVVGLDVGEGKILMKTYKFVFLNTTIATIVMLAFFFRFT